MQTATIKDLSPHKRVSYVTVRLIQMWENWSRAKEMYELGLLFIDNQGNTIEGCIGKYRVAMFTEKLREDSIYKIEQFMVAGQKMRHRVADHPYRIKLAKNTKIVEISPQPEDFPFYTYNIKSFNELENRVGDNTFLSDAIGIAIQQTDVIPSKNNQYPRRQIRIKDTTYDFTGMTVSSFLGLLAFVSTSITRWHFNPPIPEAEALSDRFEGQHYLVEWDRNATTPTEASETTLSALGSNNLCDIIAKKYKLRILITEVNEPQDLWFYSCKKCFSGMRTQDGRRKCRRCSNTESTTRYKLSVNAIDAELSNESKPVTGRFMFYVDDAGVLIGKDIALLEAQAKGRHNFIPPASAAAVGKICNVTAVVRDETYDVEEGLIMFEVKKAEATNQLSTIQAPASQSDAQTSQEILPSTNTTPTVHPLPESDFVTESTPVKDIISHMDSKIDEESSVQTASSKRRNQTSAATEPKKARTKSTKENQTARQIDFSSNQEN